MTNLSEEERRDLARELDEANACLVRASAGGDVAAQQTALSYAVAALCRAVAEVIRPEPPQDAPGQTHLWADLA